MEKLIEKSKEMYEGFSSLNIIDKYDVPFPMAVFGTLRQLPTGQGNSGLMFVREPIFHCKAFLPHFTPEGIWLNFSENSSGAFEIYFYEPKDFPAVIERVDCLEGFNSRIPHKHWGYCRTLMKVKILPDNFQHEIFDTGIKMRIRDLRIPKETWDSFDDVPAWVYSNTAANDQASEKDSLLWRSKQVETKT